MTNVLHARRARQGASNNDEGPTVAAVALQKSTQDESSNHRADAFTEQAVPTWRDRLRGGVKRAIVTAACWGFPAPWAHWLIVRGGLRDA